MCPSVKVNHDSVESFDKMTMVHTSLQKAPLPYSTDRNIIEAASSGATSSIKVVGAIAVNVMAFLSILKFVNATLTWFGERVEIEGFTFDVSW
jgi:pyrimidine nucleoside transport protein